MPCSKESSAIALFTVMVACIGFVDKGWTVFGTAVNATRADTYLMTDWRSVKKIGNTANFPIDGSYFILF